MCFDIWALKKIAVAAFYLVTTGQRDTTSPALDARWPTFLSRLWQSAKNPEKCNEIKENGGEGGIRTHDTLAGMPHFECGAFDLSATSPHRVGAF